jgi:hypothetical protein
MMAAARGEAAEYGAEGRLICDAARVTETNGKVTKTVIKKRHHLGV